MKVVFSGLESSGKSLKLAMVAEMVVKRNAKWFKQQSEDYKILGPIAFRKKYKRETPYARPIASNLRFTEKFHKFADELKIPIIYWVHKHELIKLEECDVFVDEIANYWNSRMWQEMTTAELQWLSQGAKRGIEIYGATQDFAMVDKGFRRLTNRLFYILKLIGSRRPSATKPPVTKVWGLCLQWEMDPRLYKEDSAVLQRSGIFPSPFFIQRKYCDCFDTNARIDASEAVPFRHVARSCGHPECEFKKVTHI